MTAAPILDSESCDALAESLNAGIGHSAAILCELVGGPIELSISEVRICDDRTRIAGIFPDDQRPETVIKQAFRGSIRGRTSLCFTESNGIALAKLSSGRSAAEIAELDSELSGILLEVGNIVLNGVMGSLSNVIASELHYALPELRSASRRGHRSLMQAVGDDDVLLCRVRFRIAQEEIDGTIVVVTAASSMQRIMESLLEPIPAP